MRQPTELEQTDENTRKSTENCKNSAIKTPRRAQRKRTCDEKHRKSTDNANRAVMTQFTYLDRFLLGILIYHNNVYCKGPASGETSED